MIEITDEDNDNAVINRHKLFSCKTDEDIDKLIDERIGEFGNNFNKSERRLKK